MPSTIQLPMMKVKTKPWAHQVEALHFILHKYSAMLAMDMGTGKSLVVLKYIEEHNLHKILILCPKSVIDVWPEQFKRHCDNPINVIALNSGTVANRTEKADNIFTNRKRCVIVINYEAARTGTFKIWSLAMKWDLVVCDEGHKMKAPGSKISWFCKALAKRATRRLCLTGTPMPHSPLDVYAQYRFLDSSIYGTSFNAFKSNYAICHDKFKGLVLKFKNLDDLNKKFYQIAFRVKKDDVLDLPDTIDDTRVCELSKRAMKSYIEIEKNLITEVKSGVVVATNALAKLMRLQQITSGYIGGVNETKSETLDDSKKELLKDILSDLPQEEPVVVFCRFHYDLDAIKQASEELKRGYKELSGRQNQLPDWQGGEGEILGVQIQSGGVGIDLTRASYAIYYSTGFSLGDYEQSRARVHRPGQDRTVNFIHLTAKGTVDEKIIKALKKKQDVVESVLSSMKGEPNGS